MLENEITHLRDGVTVKGRGVAVRLHNPDCAGFGTLKGNQAMLEIDRFVLGKVVTCALNGESSYDWLIGAY